MVVGNAISVPSMTNRTEGGSVAGSSGLAGECASNNTNVVPHRPGRLVNSWKLGLRRAMWVLGSE